MVLKILKKLLSPIKQFKTVFKWITIVGAVMLLPVLSGIITALPFLTAVYWIVGLSGVLYALFELM